MKTVVNKTNAPVRVSLPRGKALHLGPKKSGEIRDEDESYAGVKKLVDAGTIEVLEGGHREKGARGDAGPPHESTHGFGRGASLPQKKGGE